MRTIRHGDAGPAVHEIRQVLAALELLPAEEPAASLPSATLASRSDVSALDRSDARESPDSVFDDETVRAVRAFQQSRGLTADGRVTEETWRALEAARWRLGDRTLYHSVPEALVGEDIRALQERLLEMGYDVGRPDGIYGAHTARAVALFQREVGLAPDGSCGPQTLHGLRRLGRKVVGGRPQWLRESDRLYRAGPALIGKRVVVDPGHGGTDPGVVFSEGLLRWSEAELVWDLASRLDGRLTATGIRVHLTRGPRLAMPMPDAARAQLANDLGADLFISLHVDGHRRPEAEGLATYHYGTADGVTSTVGERLAGLVQREIVARTGMRNCQTHAKSWDLLRLTRMPAVRVDVGYLTSSADRERLTNPRFRDTVVDAILAAVQRMYYPIESDVPTGSIDVATLRATVAAEI
jgi:N-acetylmuramoyl-L-alanine amidase